MNFDINEIRKDFPILHQKVYGKPYIYLDNGATTQKPQCVIDRMTKYYSYYNSNIHRGVHYLSEKTTTAYENARKEVQNFINAEYSHEVIFTRGTTESINLVANSFGDKFISEGDEIIVSEMEHHSNIVPWQILCERKNAKLRVIPFDEKGELIIEEFDKLLNKKTRLVAVTHISNTLGTINPIKEIIEKSHKVGAKVLIDGAQAIQHTKVDVKELDCDFYVFSGHKIYAPTGIGVLYGKENLLNEMPPYQGGGDMIKNVSFEKTTYNELPFKFEAGTPHYIGAIGLKTAIQYIKELGIENIAEYENQLLQYAHEKLSKIEGLRIYGNAKNKASLVSFLIENVHPYDAGMVLDKHGIAVRTGTHCTEPVMQHFDISGTIRAAFSFYNTFEEIDVLCQTLEKIKRLFS